MPQYQENMYQFVAARKGISYDQSVAMHGFVAKMAKDAGLDYHFDKMLVTNSLKAHCLIQMAGMFTFTGGNTVPSMTGYATALF